MTTLGQTVSCQLGGRIVLPKLLKNCYVFALAISEPPGLFLAALCAADVMILVKPKHDVKNKIKKTFGAVFR